MSGVSVSISLGRSGEYVLREYGNRQGLDKPLDDTTVMVDLGEEVWLSGSVGELRRLMAAIERGIANIPTARVAVREWEARYAARRAAAKSVPA